MGGARSPHGPPRAPVPWSSSANRQAASLTSSSALRSPSASSPSSSLVITSGGEHALGHPDLGDEVVGLQRPQRGGQLQLQRPGPLEETLALDDVEVGQGGGGHGGVP